MILFLLMSNVILLILLAGLYSRYKLAKEEIIHLEKLLSTIESKLYGILKHII